MYEKKIERFNIWTFLQVQNMTYILYFSIMYGYFTNL